uniref:(northern house mosquito) hypothetical protein n=2 Tax=Culex pipiens TaxID=7175 RepID=A0A8D8CKY3_CULPI
MVTSHQRCDGGDMVPRKIMNRPISAGTGTRDDSDNASDVGTTTPGTSPKKAHKCLRSNECPGPEQMERSRNSPSPQHIPELSRRKATSLQMPSVRRTTEQDCCRPWNGRWTNASNSNSTGAGSPHPEHSVEYRFCREHVHKLVMRSS